MTTYLGCIVVARAVVVPDKNIPKMNTTKIEYCTDFFIMNSSHYLIY